MYFKKNELYVANTLNYTCNFVRKFLSEQINQVSIRKLAERVSIFSPLTSVHFIFRSPPSQDISDLLSFLQLLITENMAMAWIIINQCYTIFKLKENIF